MSMEKGTLGVTGNAQLLLGYLTGLILKEQRTNQALDYGRLHIDAASGLITLENLRSGNTFRISIEQIGGQP